MEEKERYKLESYNEAFCQIHDTESGEWYLRKDLVTDLLNQQDKQIKELEEQTYPAYKREHKRRAYLENIEVPRLKKENLQLKQQLAEKDKEIEELKMYKKGAYEKYIHKCEYLQGQIKDLYKKQNQKAIEQLEKVKSCVKINSIGGKIVNGKEIYTTKSDVSNAYFDIEANIDNQIRQLKEEK